VERCITRERFKSSINNWKNSFSDYFSIDSLIGLTSVSLNPLPSFWVFFNFWTMKRSHEPLFLDGGGLRNSCLWLFDDSQWPWLLVCLLEIYVITKRSSILLCNGNTWTQYNSNVFLFTSYSIGLIENNEFCWNKTQLPFYCFVSLKSENCWFPAFLPFTTSA